MARFLFAAWLAVFAFQATEVIAMIAPDGCTEQAPGAPGDSCPEACARCLCCARVAFSTPQVMQLVDVGGVEIADVIVPLDPSTTPSPHGIFHVPKTSLI